MLNRINIQEMSKSLIQYGYYKLDNFLSNEEIELIKSEIPLNNAANYNRENLNSNAVYPSMKSDSRESHASMMIEDTQTNDLPNVKIIGTGIRDLMRFHDEALSIILNKHVPTNNRKMVNWQLYSQEVVGDSKFLRRHRDGNYCSYELTTDKTFKVKEALYNRFIFGFNVENDNVGEVQGTSFYDTLLEEEIHPTHPKGSLIIFDNVRLEHFVRELSKPRIFLGIRSFDVDPLHFSEDRTKLDNSFTLQSLDSPGFGEFISTEKAKEILLDFYKNQWPLELVKIEAQGAVF